MASKKKRIRPTDENAPVSTVNRVPESVESVVYFLRACPGGPIKIGFTNNVEKRITALQTACPHKLKLLCTVPGTFRHESMLHAQFAASRLHGEWFKPTMALYRLIAHLRRHREMVEQGRTRYARW